MQFHKRGPEMIDFCANVAELNTLGKNISSQPKTYDRRPQAEPRNERSEKIVTYEVYQVKCNVVNGLPPRYRGERD
jgi:hypothetical protein